MTSSNPTNHVSTSNGEPNRGDLEAPSSPVLMTSPDENGTGMVFAEAVVMDDDNDNDDGTGSDHDGPIHVVAEATGVSEEFEDDQGKTNNVAQETVRLDSSHIVSIREASCFFSKRPEFLSVILCNKPAYENNLSMEHGILGISMAVQDGKLKITKIHATSPFAETAVKEGDVLVSINDTSCKGMNADHALALLLSNCSSRNGGHTTIRFHNIGGNTMHVVSTVEKQHPDTKLGIGFVSNPRGGVIVSSVSPDRILAFSLLNPDDRVIMVNEHDCSTIATTPQQVSAWIKNAPRFVTILTETTTATGVVMATGDSTATLGQTVSTPASSTPRQSTDRSKQSLGAFLAVLFIVVLVTTIALVTKNDNRSEDVYVNYNDDYFYNQRPTNNPWPTGPTLPPSPVRGACQNGSPLFSGDIPVYANTREIYKDYWVASYCESRHAMEGQGRWFRYYHDDTSVLNHQMIVSTCSSSTFDTVITVFEGNCWALNCVGYNDDGSTTTFDGLSCGVASAVEFTAEVDKTYYIWVSAFGGYVNSGNFGIKVGPAYYGASPCQC